MKNGIIILIIVVAVFAIGIFMYMNNPAPTEYGNGTGTEEEEPVFCTQEAMLCPDGSYVGRVPPTCEFAQCPIPEDAVMEDGTIMETDLQTDIQVQ
jgi:hypothetical protein